MILAFILLLKAFYTARVTAMTISIYLHIFCQYTYISTKYMCISTKYLVLIFSICHYRHSTVICSIESYKIRVNPFVVSNYELLTITWNSNIPLLNMETETIKNEWCFCHLKTPSRWEDEINWVPRELLKVDIMHQPSRAKITVRWETGNPEQLEKWRNVWISEEISENAWPDQSKGKIIRILDSVVTENLKNTGKYYELFCFLWTSPSAASFFFKEASNRIRWTETKNLHWEWEQTHWPLKHHLSANLPAPKYLMCLIYHLSLKSIPIMLEPNWFSTSKSRWLNLREMQK